MTKLDKMFAQLDLLRENAQKQLDSDDVEGAEKTLADIAAVEKKIKMQKKLDEQENEDMAQNAENLHEPVTVESKTKENATFIRAAIKSMTGKAITTAEKALLLPTTTSPNGANGEGYILPQDIRTKINKRIREFRSFRTILGFISTKALSGSFVVENIDGIAGLVSFEDGGELTESEDPKFEKATFSLKEYGAIIKMSKVLLEMSNEDLESYIVDYFAKKAVITENEKALEALRKGKAVKTLSCWSALKSSINKDLDPASLYGTVIVTNQDGFDFLDSQLDANGRPILQPDPTNPTVKRFVGYEIKVFSNALLKSTAPTTSKAGYAPIFYGNLSEGAKFVDNGYYKFATSEHAGFTKNVTMARLIELFDVIQWDSSDACYIVGQLEVAPKTATSG